MKMIDFRELKTASIATALGIALAGCGGKAPSAPATPGAPASPTAPETALGRAAEQGINQARAKLKSEDISLNGDGEGGAHIGSHRIGNHDPNLPRAAITPKGDLLIDGKAQPLTDAQRQLVLDYRHQVEGIAEAGMKIGVQGADIAGKALGGVAETVFGGEEGRKAFEARMKAEGQRIEQQALGLCNNMAGLLAAQDKLAAALPAFKPYATMTQQDIDDCGKNARKSGTTAAHATGTGSAEASASSAATTAAVTAAATANAAEHAADDAERSAKDAERRAERAAKQPCGFKRAIDLKLDTTGIRTVQFRISGDDIVIDANAAAPSVTGAACASNQAGLDSMKIEQQREGDRLVVRAWHTDGSGGMNQINIGPIKISRYAYMRLNANIPETVTVQVVAGSGDVTVNNAMRASVDLGSGDVVLNRVRQGAYLKVGSGDIEVNGAGGAHVLEIGSGDAVLRDVAGTVRIDEIGSGDLTVRNTGGDITLADIGSGDALFSGVGGNVSVERVGSGDVTVQDVKGGLTVRKIGSGDVNHRRVAGPVSLPSER